MLHHCTHIILAESNRYLQSKAALQEPPIAIAVLGDPSEGKHSKGIIMRLVDIVSIELGSSPNEYVPQGDGFVVRKAPGAFNL